MAKRIVLMFSMLVASIAILLTSDLIGSQMIYNQLDSVATTVGYYISKDGGITEGVISYVKKEVNAKIYTTLPEGTIIKAGDMYPYVIEREYIPIILLANNNKVSVTRTVVIGL